MRIGRVAIGLAVAAVAATGVVVLSSGDNPDPLQAFCSDAGGELDGLAGSANERAAALGRLSDSAPDDLVDLVDSASQVASDVAVEDMFVVPGDENSGVKADVAAEVWTERVTIGQAWDRVERVLVGDCELELDEGTR